LPLFALPPSFLSSLTSSNSFSRFAYPRPLRLNIS
jgi:hypothetical protein